MTNDDLIERLWAKREEEPKMTREEIARALRPRLGRSSNILKFYLWFYLGALLATLVLQGINLAGYRTNATMLAVHAAVTVAALSFVAFGIHMAGAIGRLDRMDEHLADAVNRRLAFFRGKYEVWLWACSVSLLLLTWAINTLVDNADGTYRINKPFVFFGTQAVMLFGMYAVFKAAHLPVVRELRAVLEDLKAQMMGHTEAADALKERWRRWWVVLVVFLTIMLLLGVWMAVRRLG
jgi:hypothetical protein